MSDQLVRWLNQMNRLLNQVKETTLFK
jgi:hypothetical protein